MSIFRNSSHLEWREGLSDIIVKGTHQGTIPARFGLIWFRGFRGKDLNVNFYQNMPNLHNWYKSAETKFHRKTRNIETRNPKVPKREFSGGEGFLWFPRKSK
jgi:hypothetical protein